MMQDGRQAAAIDEPALLRIGDVAKKTGMTLRTLRYYEELQLIEPDNRTKGNFRLYHPSVLRRIEFINSLKKLDFSLEEIHEILGDSHNSGCDSEVIEQTRQILLIKKEKIQNKLIELADMNREVDLSLKMLDDCVLCKATNTAKACEPDCDNRMAHLP